MKYGEWCAKSKVKWLISYFENIEYFFYIFKKLKTILASDQYSRIKRYYKIELKKWRKKKRRRRSNKYYYCYFWYTLPIDIFLI